jgi:hypothetical protein
MLLLVTVVILCTTIFTCYLIVLGNVGNMFPLQETYEYYNSPYWVGLPKNKAVAVSILQVFALVGMIIWFTNLIKHPPSSGFLKEPVWRTISVCLFLVPSAIWPYTAYNYALNPTVGSSILSSSFLWLASLGVIMMIAGTFVNENATPEALIGVIWLGAVVILADGIGWSMSAITKANED